MGPRAAAIYKFVYYINFKLFFIISFVLGSITFEVRMFNAIKKGTYFVSPAPLLPSRTQVRFYISVEQVVGKTSDLGNGELVWRASL